MNIKRMLSQIDSDLGFDLKEYDRKLEKITRVGQGLAVIFGAIGIVFIYYEMNFHAIAAIIGVVVSSAVCMIKMSIEGGK